MTYTIKRENSKYNKYMKWHLIGKSITNGIFSQWYKTKKEALYYKKRYENQDNLKYLRNDI